MGSGGSELSVSVIVPVGPGERAWIGLLGELRGLPQSWEVILVGVSGPPAPEGDREGAEVLADGDVGKNPAAAPGGRWVVSPRGRARQMNAGARAARGDYLWFLHADSRFGSENLGR